MRGLRLTPIEERVYQAATGLEARGEVPYLSAIARESGLSEEEVLHPLHELTAKSLLRREDSPQGNADLGPRWCAKERA
ncbi:MAG TPA: hypothetical protein VIL44_03805 [Micromonospora sp.]|jgi:hypothetical protein